MDLIRPLIFFDVEATGVDPATDRIVSMACLKMIPATLFEPDAEQVQSWRFNPERAMSEEVIAIHGITNEAVAREKPFRLLAADVHKYVQGADLAGFNLRNYDIPILWEEFHRAGIAWDLTGVRVVDVSCIFRKKEERTLAAAVQFYCAQSLEGAHDAGCDAAATRSVLFAQLVRYPDLSGMSLEQLAEFSKMDERVDLAGKIIMKNGVPVYNLRRVQDVPVEDDPGFARWMLDRDFSQNTKMHLRRILGCGEPEEEREEHDYGEPSAG